MQSDWPIVPLESVTVNFDTKRKPVKEADRRPGPFPYYGASGVVDHVDGFLFDGEYLLIAEDGENLRTRNTPIAFRAMGRFWVNNHAHIVQGNERARTRFLEYAILAADIAPFLTGAVMPKLTQGNLNKIPVACPSLEIQDAVIDILGRIDDRIDLLRQTNTTLESIAQALFKSWFIDFDPVRAKSEGREPEGMDAATAALFPAEFEESALGLIPKGWRVNTLADHVIAERGLSYKGAGLCEAGEGLPMHNLNSVLEGGNYKYAGIKHYRGDYKDRHIAVAGDVIVANTEQGHNHRLIGFPAIVPARYARAIYSHHIYRVRLKPESPLTTHVLYYTLMAPAVREQVIGCANGSTVNMLKVAGLEIPQFVCPSADVAQAFERLANPLRKQMEANVERVEVLSALRDTLLPRLISGSLKLTVEEDIAAPTLCAKPHPEAVSTAH